MSDEVKKKIAIITGVYGQDGSLLAEYLVNRGFRVVGLVHRLRKNIKHFKNVKAIQLDISNQEDVEEVIKYIKPNEFYHLAAYHHSSEQKPGSGTREAMLHVNFLSTQTILDALLQHAPDCRFLFAGSSQMYTPAGDITVIDETTPYRPSTYYGVTKVASAHLVDLLRRSKGLWGVNAILFNHESTRRREQFLTRKVTRYVAKAAFKKWKAAITTEDKLHIRNTNARTDWSAATDFVQAFHLALQADEPGDYVLASGKVHSVVDLLEESFGCMGLDWRDFVIAGEECGDPGNGASPPCIKGNPQRAMEKLSWRPRKAFKDLIREMVYYDLELLAGKQE